MGSTGFRNPWALSSALATLGHYSRPRALGFLNPVDPLYTVQYLTYIETYKFTQEQV